jgi:CRISPR system Cascade subunit CasE
MARMALDGKGLTTLGRMKRLPLRTVGTPYLVHCALGELFGDHAPKPYSIEPSSGSRQVHVLGYTDAGKDALRAQAEMGASPTVYEICDWAQLAVKPMPDHLPEGLTLRFELQACPVIRKGSAGSVEIPTGDGDPARRSWREGDELDAFLNAAWTRPGNDLSREQVYSDWLRRQLDIRGGAELQTVGMERFSIERMTRRNHSSGGTTQIKRPDVTLTGTLSVTDPDAFQHLLRSGIGRHKTFGYGMLKIRRA